MPCHRVLASFLCGLSCVVAALGAGCSNPAPQQQAPAAEAKREIALETVASGLDTPWAMAFTPDGRILVTERPGRIRVIDKNGLRPQPWALVDVLPMTYQTEGGLLGIAIAPDFGETRHVFVVGTFAGKDRLTNKVLRFTERDGQGTDQTTIIESFPDVNAAPGVERAIHTHIGGALAFGFIGVFIGPTLLAVGYRLFEEWIASKRPVVVGDPSGKETGTA